MYGDIVYLLKGTEMSALLERNIIDSSSSRHFIDLSRLIKILNSDLPLFIIISQIGPQSTWTSNYVGIFKIHVFACGFDIKI